MSNTFRCDTHGTVSDTCTDACNIALRNGMWTDTGLGHGRNVIKHPCGCVDVHVDMSDGTSHVQARTVCASHKRQRDAHTHRINVYREHVNQGRHMRHVIASRFTLDHEQVAPRMSDDAIESYAHARGYDSYMALREEHVRVIYPIMLTM